MKIKIGNYPTYRFYHHWLYRWFKYTPTQSIKVKIDKWDTHSMDHTLACIILPMLKQFKALDHSYPANLTKEEWEEIQNKMIYAFEHKLIEFDDTDPNSYDKMQEGFELFGAYYQGLWD